MELPNPLDLSQIKNEEQLIALVKVRYSLPYGTAKVDVEGWMAGKQFRRLFEFGLDGCASRSGRTISGDQSMATEFYVVRHHGAWRIRVNGKHDGEYVSRVSAINAAVTEAQAAGLGAKVFSTGIISQFSDEWPSWDGTS